MQVIVSDCEITKKKLIRNVFSPILLECLKNVLTLQKTDEKISAVNYKKWRAYNYAQRNITDRQRKRFCAIAVAQNQ